MDMYWFLIVGEYIYTPTSQFLIVGEYIYIYIHRPPFCDRSHVYKPLMIY